MSIFSKVELTRPKKSKFRMSHERKFTMKMGALVPILCEEVLPGDRWRLNSENLVRFAPLLAPMMHRVDVIVEGFFVPRRILWDSWEDFITGGPDGTLAPVHPFANLPGQFLSGANGYLQEPGSLMDYLGIPVPDVYTAVNSKPIDILPFRAYQNIYNEYYRDQNISDPVAFVKTSGEVSNTQQLIDLMTLRNRAWEKDYGTSALPWAQRGGDVKMSFDGDASVVYHPTGTKANVAGATGFTSDGSGTVIAQPSGNAAIFDNIESVDLSDVGITINELRRSNRLQMWLERNARAGGRYVEQLLSQWAVRSSDARLQRPEYLFGSRKPVVVSEVLSNFQFSGDTNGLPQGNMAGHGISVGGGNGFSRQFEEHGIVIVLMSVLPRTAYLTQLRKQFQRFDKLDYPWPEFAYLGEQEVKRKEIHWWAGAPAGEGEETFGYQSRYAECKFIPSTVHGEFRTTLAHWHMARKFPDAYVPNLNESYVMSDPTNRVFAVDEANNQNLWCQVYNDISLIRALPYHGTPRL